MNKRTESEIIADIASTYSALSPENLYCDGERSRSAARSVAVKLNAKLKALFKELGREIGECDSYEIDRRRRYQHLPGFVPGRLTGN